MLDGRIKILTPEGVSLEMTPAGPGPRFYAWCVDTLLLIMLLSISGMVLSWSEAGSGIMLVILFLLWWGYPVFFEVLWGGKTPGKAMLHLQVVRHDGLPVGWSQSMMRNILLAADFLPVLFGAGLVCMLSDRQFRRLGDHVARTVVIYKLKASNPPRWDSVSPVPLPFPLLAAEQRSLIDLAERLPRLSVARQSELGDLAQPLTGCTSHESVVRLQEYAAGLME